uniref:Uncharacterized protein n=1 Tax=Neobodo designis TaxID=312471 RepID=A0A6U4QR30_NEODS|mmetsp:Transcript_20093/g.62414  ORF Transcript_20093/g.62414 Transcript_20093/m.62414 type:complete len:199 (+) Transcript_20093:29-625(+)|eukprot:CAMPEP_0174831594 /NCGR_PEP_ID=MMETSP1114-20130205/3184_1 /TAXON_ID=312471 /ORGANISM="Neobodo designis, Strain CCAP 1951/1" /LENGTH=198 /DNA_ID=CAMNT_0016065421 /DNA_START=24 /DNA_END=620 /DNA_ORIENTATION=-
MALYDDAAFDDELADDWEAALVAEEEKEALAAAEEKEREAAKALRAQKKKRVQSDDEESDNEAQGEGAEDMKAMAMDREAAQDLLGGGARVPIAKKAASSAEERASFVADFLELLQQHQTKSHYGVMFSNLVKHASENMSVDELQDVLRAVKVAAKEKKPAGKKASGATSRGRNIDMDAFDGVTDRGGAAVTEHEDFM